MTWRRGQKGKKQRKRERAKFLAYLREPRPKGRAKANGVEIQEKFTVESIP